MEISARVYAAAKGEDKLKEIYSIMQECVCCIANEGYYFSKPIGINGWLELEEREYYTYRFNVSEEDDWKGMLERVGEELGEDGVVIVEFGSPDSDSFSEHAASTASGDVIFYNTEYDFSDFENFDKRMDKFKRKFVKAYRLGEALYQWFMKEEITSVPIEKEEDNNQGIESSDTPGSDVNCVCALITLLFNNKQKISFSTVKREGSGEEYQDCFYLKTRGNTEKTDISIGALFSKIAEERENIDAIKELLKGYVEPAILESLNDGLVIIDGNMDVNVCVSKGNKSLANPFVVLGMKDIPSWVNKHTIIELAHEQGLEKYYDDTLETLFSRRNKGSQSFLFYFYDDEDICLETAGQCYKKDGLKLADLGNIIKAKYKIIDIARDSEHSFDYTPELVEDVVAWAKDKKPDLNVSTDMKPVELFNALGLSARIEDNGYGTDVLKLEGEVDCSELPNSFLELVTILIKYVDSWHCEIEAIFDRQQEPIVIEAVDGQLFFKMHKDDEVDEDNDEEEEEDEEDDDDDYDDDDDDDYDYDDEE